MEDLKKMLNALIPILGDAAVSEVTKQLEELIGDQTEPWKAAALALISEAVNKYGPQGIDLAVAALNDLMDGKAPEIDWADLETASNILAQLQNAEAKRRTAAKDFMAKLAESLGTILSGIIRGLISK